MRHLPLILALLVVSCAVAASMVDLEPRRSENLTRACIFAVGGWTEIDCSAGAADNVTALETNSRYAMQCVGDSHVAWGDSTGDDADANDGYLPGGGWVEFATTDTVRWVSCNSAVGQGDAGKCYIIECK